MFSSKFPKSLLALFLVVLMSSFLGCGDDEDSEELENQLSSRAYKGHEDDMDANNLVSVYPSVVGTRLDDCQTCHTGKIEEGKLAGSSCDYCHELIVHGTGHTAIETLNSFGLDYYNTGRDKAAIKDIKGKDSDGDGFTNDDEIMAQRYPGSSFSQPGQSVAAMRIVSIDDLQAMPSHTQFQLSNTTKQQFDDYVTYKGVKIKDIFDSLGIDLSGATGITVIAPDGFMKSIPIESIDKVFPQPLFYSGLDVDTLGSDCGFVAYPEQLPEGLTNGSPISGDHCLMLGYERDGMLMDTSYLDVAEGKIIGEGPFRMVVPQSTPGTPDRGLKYSPTDCNDGYDFDDNADHNAGSMVRGTIAIRIDPMPEGVEEFDYMNGGWAYIDGKQLIIYGHNVQ